MKSKQLIGILAMVLLVFSAAAVYAACTGSVWTTDELGGVQDKNLYATGETVYLNAAGFDADAECTYEVIHVSAPGNPKPVVASGDVVMDGSGAIDAYLIWDTTGAAGGEYKVEVTCGTCKKSDNFRVEENQVPEFGLIAAGLALGGAGIGFATIRRRK
jgi:hypothetical protein